MILIVPIIVIAMILMGAQMMSRSHTGMKMATNNIEYLQVEMCTQQCASLAINMTSMALNNWKSIPTGSATCQCNTADGLAVQTCERTLGKTTQKLELGCYGVQFSTLTLPVTSTCKDAHGQKATLELDADLREIPIFQFAFFYENYLEIQPGMDLTLNGRIHSNDTIQISPAKDMFFDNWITTPGALGLEDGGGGPSFFAKSDFSGPDKSGIKSSGKFKLLENVIGSSNWTEWKKNHLVAYANQGNNCPAPNRLTLPFSKITDYHVIIDWRDSTNDDTNIKRNKYAWNASLIYKNGNWLNNNLSPALLAKEPIHLPPKLKVSTTNPNRVTFWEPRDAMMLQVLPIDIEILQQRTTDDIIYLYDTLPDPDFGNKHVGGFLLYNAAKLTRPLTIVTSTRLVVYGDFNTDKSYTTASGPKGFFPASLVSDCMIHISDLFNPEEHTFDNHIGRNEFGKDMSSKKKYRLTLNSNVMTGMKKYNGTQRGQGGANNLVRMLENWGNNEYEKNGSMVCIWYSRDSYGNYLSYDPPNRFWSFDTMYNDTRNMPPGTPRLISPSLASWEFIRK